MITEEEKRMLVTLAMRIDIGEMPAFIVVEVFDKNPISAAQIIDFWYEFNDMTRRVADYVGYEKCRKHLEKCYKIRNGKCLRMKQNLTVIANGLKQILYGVKECIIGVFQDFIQD